MARCGAIVLRLAIPLDEAAVGITADVVTSVARQTEHMLSSLRVATYFFRGWLAMATALVGVWGFGYDTTAAAAALGCSSLSLAFAVQRPLQVGWSQSLVDCMATSWWY